MRRLCLAARSAACAWAPAPALNSVLARAATTARSPPQAGSKPRSRPGLLGPSGAPLPPRSAAGEGKNKHEVELTAQNSREVLTSPGAFVLQVGKMPQILTEKLDLLFEGADGKLPLVKLDVAKFPQVAQALKIVTPEAVLLLAGGRVIDALEGEEIFATEQAVGFVERVAKALGLQIDLAGDITQQIEHAELLEASDPSNADVVYAQALGDAEASSEIRVRALAGRSRCALRQGDSKQAELILDELRQVFESMLKLPEVKQAEAMLQLQGGMGADVETLRAAAEANPSDIAALEAYVAALFWQGDAEKEAAVAAALGPIRRRDRSEASRALATRLIDALGPKHPLQSKAQKDFKNLLFM